MFAIAAASVEDHTLSELSLSRFQKMMQIFLLGELLDLPTLCSILRRFGIASNKHQIAYKYICKNLTNSKLHAIFEYVFEAQLSEVLSSLGQKDSSAFSRTLVTVILDDSVFKQWLTKRVAGETDIDKCWYGKFFSGQTHCPVMGYQIVALGINVGDVFYPLYFHSVAKSSITKAEQKAQEEVLRADWAAKKEVQTVQLAEINTAKVKLKDETDEIEIKVAKNAVKELQIAYKAQNKLVGVAKLALKAIRKIKIAAEKHVIAERLIEKAGRFIEKTRGEVKEKGGVLPTFLFSCDSGYASVSLSRCCEKYSMGYISVPAKSHNFIIKKQKTSLKKWIDDTFIAAEAAHNLDEKDLLTADKTPFVYRQRAFYCAKDQDVTLLAFRLQNSKKITVIYTPDPNIKGKTLRRHWFARTQIEQFFKLLKHYMKIQNARTTQKHDFDLKLLRFVFAGLHLQHIIRHLRKYYPIFKRYGLGTLRILLQNDTIIPSLLSDLLQGKTAHNR